MKGVKFTAREKLRALQMWLSGEDSFRVAKKCKCTDRSLRRWRALYDGTLESLENKSSRPHKAHPNSHTQEETDNIIQMLADNPTMGYTELYGELRARFAYSRHYLSMYKFIRKHCLRPAEVYVDYIPQPYETPEMLGIKMQMDVKYVPRECLIGKAKRNYDQIGEKFYQYTIIDEATRERFIYAYREHSGYSTQDFIKRAVLYFGYAPATIQTDNGTEFTNPRGTGGGKVHIADEVMNQLKIRHQLIRVYTLRHNGKVERSHRTDQEKFYRYSTFETFEELQSKMAAWLTRYNNSPSTALRNRHGKKVFQSPLDKRAELLEILKEESNKQGIRFLKKSPRAA